MKHKLISRLAALLTAAMLFTGAAGALADAEVDPTAQSEAEATAGAEPTADARPGVDASVVATLGDIAITADETADLFSYVLEMYSYYGYDVTDESIRSELESITLDAMVASKVQELMESELGFDQFTDEELAEFAASAQATYDETWTSVYDSFDDGETGEAELKAQTQAELDKYGYTVDALLEQEKAEAAYDRLYEYLTKDVEVTEDDVAASYAETVAYDKELYADDPSGYTLQCMYGDRPAYTPEGIRTVKHILINYLDEDKQKISELAALSEKPEDYDQQYEALKQQAYANIKDKVDEVMARIAAGEDFDALVEEYGEDPGMTADPYKSEGYMVFDGCTNLVTEFVESAMALEQIGDVTAEPALTEYGAHIMLYFSDLAPGEVELSADKADEIRESLMDTKRSDAFNAAVDARQAELGELFLYPENLTEASYDEPAEAADEDADNMGSDRAGSKALDAAFDADELNVAKVSWPDISSQNVEVTDEVLTQLRQDGIENLDDWLDGMQTYAVSLSPDGTSGIFNGGICLYQGRYHILHTSQSRGVADEYGNLQNHVSRFRNSINPYLAIGREGAVYSPDGRYLAMFNGGLTLANAKMDDDPVLIDLSTGEAILTATYANMMLKEENAGAIVSATFSADGNSFYYIIYGNATDYRTALYRYDMNDGTTELCCSAGDFNGYPMLGETFGGDIIAIRNPAGGDEYTGITLMEYNQDGWNAQELAFNLPCRNWRCNRMQYSKQSGMALCIGRVTKLDSSFSYALQCIEPDDGFAGMNEYIAIPKEGSCGVRMTADGYLNLIDEVIEKDYADCAYRRIMDAQLSPDGRYALLWTQGEGQAVPIMMRLADLELREVRGIDEKLACELFMSMANYKEQIVSWGGDMLIFRYEAYSFE